MTEGDELYVDLGGGENTPDPNAPLMTMLHRMQREMVQLKSHNERLSLASEDQDRVIRELTSRIVKKENISEIKEREGSISQNILRKMTPLDNSLDERRNYRVNSRKLNLPPMMERKKMLKHGF